MRALVLAGFAMAFFCQSEVFAAEMKICGPSCNRECDQKYGKPESRDARVDCYLKCPSCALAGQPLPQSYQKPDAMKAP
jgi:hypothetical protein